MTNVQKIFLGVCLAGLLGFLVPTALYWRHLNNFSETPGPSTTTTEVQIETGSNPRQVARLLEEKGLITSAQSFYHYLRYVARNADFLQAGDYEFAAGATPAQIITALQKGRTKEIRFTIPEGANKQDIAQIIELAGFGSKNEMLALMNDKATIEEFGIPTEGAGGQSGGISGGIEGYLFPDTYQFPKKTSQKTILLRMRERLDQVLDEEMRARMVELGMGVHQVLTLASIVEKETGDPLERPQIASVFFNRLVRGMKLQTDPTVIYSISNYAGKISRAHLQRESPYNTYVNVGLPPGPIASPGIEAIKAVLWPSVTNYLYFVSRNDGTHEFCENYQCHLRFVKKWQIDYFKNKKQNQSMTSRTVTGTTSTN